MSSILSSTTSAMRSTKTTSYQLLRATTAASSSSSSTFTQTPTTTSSSNPRRTVTTRSRTPHDPQSTASARIYTPRKEFLFKTYSHLLETSQAVIVFQPNNLSSAELAKIRRAIKGVPVTKGMLEDVQPASSSFTEEAGSTPPPPSPTEESLESIKATFTIARTGLLSAVVRSSSSEGSPSSSSSLSPLLSGPVALLTTPSLSPPYLKSLFAAINKSLGYRPPPPNASLNTTPTSPRLILLGALLESDKLLSASELTALIASTPELSTLRAQLVGLLEMPGRSLLGVTQMAGGGGLVRTLMGLEAGLKEQSQVGQGEAEGKAE